MLSPESLLAGRYKIVRAIGRGGMGEVYEALQVDLGRRVALKTIRAELATHAVLLARFRAEAEAAAALGHPNLVQVTDFSPGAPGEPAFLVMEMLDGTTLADVLVHEGRIDPARAAFIGVQVLSGLAAAHRAGIVHRDVKPANLFLQSTSAMRDIVKVLDFGVAKLALDADGSQRSGGPMTAVGQVVGTLSYMAPEQGAHGGMVDARTDVFAVGATLFHALAGVRPLDALEPSGARIPLDRAAPWVPRELAAVVERALERMQSARWPSADAMATALQPFAQAASAASFAFAATSAAAAAPPAPPGALARAAPAGWDPSAIGARVSQPMAPPAMAPPMAPVGSPPIGPPPVGSLPMGPPYGYGPPAGVPYVSRSRSTPPWSIFVVVAVVVFGAVPMLPMIASLIAVRNATNPSSIATQVEREFLKNPAAQKPCPAPDQCTLSREEHGLTYPLCTRKLPALTPYKPGDMIVAGSDTRVAVVMKELPARRYSVRFLTGQTEVTIDDDDIAGRLCAVRAR